MPSGLTSLSRSGASTTSTLRTSALTGIRYSDKLAFT